MRLLDARSSHWAIRHIYVVMVLVGVTMVALAGPVSSLYAPTEEQLTKAFENELNGIDDGTDFVYLHNGGDGAVVAFSLFGLGGGLIVISPVLAIGYELIRRGATFKLKSSNVD